VQTVTRRTSHLRQPDTVTRQFAGYLSDFGQRSSADIGQLGRELTSNVPERAGKLNLSDSVICEIRVIRGSARSFRNFHSNFFYEKGPAVGRFLDDVQSGSSSPVLDDKVWRRSRII
jgi:hypothetical protein